MLSAVLFVLIAALVALLIHFSPIEPNPHVFTEPPPRLTGVLQPNEILAKARRIYEGKFIGPESFTSDRHGHVYTGTADGRIWRVRPDESAEVLGRVGRDLPGCGQVPSMEIECGRPKGVKVNPEGTLLWFVDAYQGLMRMDVETRKITNVVPRNPGVDGIPLRFVNNLDVASDGTVYFTSSSTKWDRKDYRLEVIELDSTARIISYNPQTGIAKTLAYNLTLANGLALSPDESSLLFSEMSLHRIRRLHLRGSREGQLETVADNLPGYPDNIKRRPGRRTYFLGFTVTRYSAPSKLGLELPPMLDLLAPYPAAKKLMASITPNWAYKLFIPKHAYFVEIDENGNILQSVHDPDGSSIWHMSEAYETPSGKIFLGSHENPYLGVLDAGHLK